MRSLAIIALVVSACVLAQASLDGLASKLDPFLTKHTTTLNEDEVLSVFLRVGHSHSLEELRALVPANATRVDRIKSVTRFLRSQAELHQGPLRAHLRELAVEHASFWIVNAVQAHMNLSTLAKVAAHPSVVRVDSDQSFKAQLETPDYVEDPSMQYPREGDHAEWNVRYIHAEDVWHTGIRGEGMVLANADTGVQYSHPALVNQYRGTLESGHYDHNYNWWDAVPSQSHYGSSCGGKSTRPCDDHGHGSHTTGTAVGGDGGSNVIGVAYEAKWIACRNMDAGTGKPSYYISCLQFFMAPTDLEGRDPKEELAPHVVSNSYGCPPNEGCGPLSLTEAVDAIVAAGIFMSVSAGNDGPQCATVDSPPGTIESVFSVAAAMKGSNSVASYSSRGPVTVDHSNRVKPDIIAPGSSVRSCVPTNSYAVMSGTSMAAPAVAGSVLLLWQSDPTLIGDIEATRERLSENALTLHSTTICNEHYGIPTSERDLAYGSGMINIYDAVLDSARDRRRK